MLFYNPHIFSMSTQSCSGTGHHTTSACVCSSSAGRRKTTSGCSFCYELVPCYQEPCTFPGNCLTHAQVHSEKQSLFQYNDFVYKQRDVYGNSASRSGLEQWAASYQLPPRRASAPGCTAWGWGGCPGGQRGLSVG